MSKPLEPGFRSWASERAHPDNFDRIGRYEILSELGRGAVGRVFLARDPNINRQVALKVFAPREPLNSGQQADLHRRFVLEAQAAGRLRHPGIVTIYDAESDLDAGHSFIAMEYVDGESLKDRLDRSGALSVDEVLPLIGQVALALDAAHAEGLVHRDIKPANILIGSDGVAKVTDFGVVKFTSMSNTVSGTIFGSPFYMSPEQLREENIDGRSDLFSLGVVLYECVTGEVPFTGSTIPAITYKILEIDPRPPQWMQSSIPDPLAQVMVKALAKVPAERFQSGREFADALAFSAPNTGSESALFKTPPTIPEDSEQRGVRVPEITPESPTADLSTAGGVSDYELRRATKARLLGREAWESLNWSVVIGAVALLSLVLLLTSPVGIEMAEVESELELREPPSTEEYQVEFPESPPEPADVGPDFASPDPAILPMSNLELRYNNRLRHAALSVWLNDRKLWSEDLFASKNVFKRLAGSDVRATLQVPVGEQEIEVRLRRSEGKADLSGKVAAKFELGREHVLRIRYVPPRHLRLLLTTEHDE